MNEPLILLLQKLQNTLVPAILAGTGCILIIASVVGSFWKRDITSGRRKAIGCFGFLFLLFSMVLYGVPLLLHTYAPTLTIGKIFTFLEQGLILFLRGLQNTPIPPILAGSGCVIIIISLIGIFGGHNITRKQTILSACFGIVLLLLGIFSYEVPLFLPQNLPSNNGKETLIIFFREDNKGATTKLSYYGITTISVSGEAKVSGVGYADAFYFYGHFTSHPIHRTDYTIWVNSKPIDMFMKIPPYEKDHTYTFKINVPRGYLTFGVGSSLTADKTGYFTIYLS